MVSLFPFIFDLSQFGFIILEVQLSDKYYTLIMEKSSHYFLDSNSKFGLSSLKLVPLLLYFPALPENTITKKALFLFIIRIPVFWIDGFSAGIS
jgi:hypothetical protein